MRIVFTITGFTKCVGGAERSLTEIANAMYKKGHDIIILNNEKQQKNIPFYNLNPNIPIVNIHDDHRSENQRHIKKTQLFKRILRILRIRAFKKRLAKLMNYMLSLSLFDCITWKKSYGPLINRYKRIVVEIEPDIVVAFMPRTFTYLAQALKSTKIPWIAVHRNSVSNDFTKGKYNLNSYDLCMRKKAIELANSVVVQMDIYKKYFIPGIQKKTFVIPNIVVRPTIGNNIKKRKCILNVGRLTKQKNQILLIKSFFLICDKYPEWNVEIYGGDGPLENKVKEYIAKSKLNKRVFIKGIVKEIHEIYASSEIFAFPSLWEGFSRAHSEAMSHGLPSIVLDSCEYSNEIIASSSGGLIAANNSYDFAEKLEYLIQNPELRNIFGNNAKNYVKKYEPSRIFDTWEEVMKKTISASGSL